MAHARVSREGKADLGRIRRGPEARADLESERRRMREVLKILKREYPDAECSLDYGTPFQLLIATILSAQCTDERVNLVTPELFRRFPGPKELARASVREIEQLIQSTGFFRSKALAISETSKAIVERHGGEVPRTMEELIRLRGVGRKTANVVLGNAFRVPGLVVDTHVGRISRRLGFTRATDPSKVELEMMDVVPREDWTLFAHLLIHHGREICMARKPLCPECPLSRLCPKVGVPRDVQDGD